MSEKEASQDAKEVEVAGTEKSEKSETFLWMDKEMIPCKLLFFMMDMGWSCGFAFMSLFYIEAGLTVSRLGFASCIGSVISLIVHPLWGIFMDSMKRNRILFVTVMVFLTITIEFSKPWVVMFVSKYDYPVVCTNVTINSTHPTNLSYGSSHFRKYYQNFGQTLQPLPSPHRVNNFPELPLSVVDTTTNFNLGALSNISSNVTFKEVCKTKRVLANPDTLFYAVAANGLLSSLIVAGMMSFTEAAIIKTVFTRKKAQSYGEQKVFGPIGSSIGSLMAGVAVDHFHPKNMSKYMITFFMYVPLSLLQLPLLYIITKQADWDYGTRKKDEKKVSAVRHVLNAFKNFDNLIFLLCVLFSGTSLIVYYHFLFIYVDKNMHPTKTLLSLSSVVSMASELFIYPISSKLIKLVGGRMRCVVLGIASTALRLWLLCQCQQAWHILLIQPLNGIGVSLGWTAMIEHCWAIFPKEITTTAIGILVSLHWIGPSIAVNLVGSQLYQKYGGPPVFKGMSYIAGAWCVIMLIYLACRQPVEQPSQKEEMKEKQKEQEKEDQAEQLPPKELGMYKDIELEEVVGVGKIEYIS